MTKQRVWGLREESGSGGGGGSHTKDDVYPAELAAEHKPDLAMVLVPYHGPGEVLNRHDTFLGSKDPAPRFKRPHSSINRPRCCVHVKEGEWCLPTKVLWHRFAMARTACSIEHLEAHGMSLVRACRGAPHHLCHSDSPGHVTDRLQHRACCRVTRTVELWTESAGPLDCSEQRNTACSYIAQREGALRRINQKQRTAHGATYLLSTISRNDAEDPHSGIGGTHIHRM